MAEYAYNGWLASANPADFGGLQALVVAGESFAPGVRAGDVHDVLAYVAEQLNARVEPVVRPDWHQADDWGYSYRQNRNANNLSCHAAGCAIDFNATRHPNNKSGTFTAAQVAEIRKILAEVGGVVQWGGDFTGTKDEMHFEIKGNAAQVAAVAARLRTPVPPVTPLPTNGSGRATVKLGSKGQPVNDLQARLNRDYPAYRTLTGNRLLVVDGDFGANTDKWVREFQKRSNLAVDGVVGPKTWAKLGL